MIELNVILETMAKAMLQAMEQAADTGTDVEVAFIVEGGTGRIAPKMKRSTNGWPGAHTNDGHIVGDFKP